MPRGDGQLPASITLTREDPNAKDRFRVMRVAAHRWTKGVGAVRHHVVAPGFGALRRALGGCLRRARGGLGLEAQARHNFPNYWSVGGGLQYSRHNFSENLTLDQPLSLVGAFIEPRRVIPTSSSKVAPYASGRLAILRQGTEVLGNNVSATGVQLNVGGGVLVAMNPKTNLDLGLTLGRVQFGEYSTGVDAGSGTNIVLRVGISRGVGK